MGGKVKNPYYKAFLDGYLLEVIDRKDLTKVLNDIQHRYRDQARCLVILLWSTGRRPNEVLRLVGESFIKSKEFLEIRFPASKGSKATTLSLPFFNDKTGDPEPLTNEVWEYVSTIFPTQYLFWFFRSEAKRMGVTKSYKRKNQESGEIETVTKTYDKIYDELSSKLRYYIPKWFKVIFPEGIPPYYLRHNRGTVITETVGGAATTHVLGHQSEKTRRHYEHQTRKMRRKISKGLLK